MHRTEASKICLSAFLEADRTEESRNTAGIIQNLDFFPDQLPHPGSAAYKQVPEQIREISFRQSGCQSRPDCFISVENWRSEPSESASVQSYDPSGETQPPVPCLPRIRQFVFHYIMVFPSLHSQTQVMIHRSLPAFFLLSLFQNREQA